MSDPFREDDGGLTPLAYFLIASGGAVLLFIILLLFWVFAGWKKPQPDPYPYYNDFRQSVSSSKAV